jgi:hypothetical protein
VTGDNRQGRQFYFATGHHQPLLTICPSVCILYGEQHHRKGYNRVVRDESNSQLARQTGHQRGSQNPYIEE